MMKHISISIIDIKVLMSLRGYEMKFMASIHGFNPLVGCNNMKCQHLENQHHIEFILAPN